MSVLIVGLSHRTAPIDVLEQVSVDPAGALGLADRIHSGQHVEEALVLSTCNRLEVVAEAGTFHGALAEVGDALCAVSGLTRDELTPHLYVHHDERAVAHLFAVASGLDSMAVGESQILGQLRDALTEAQGRDQVGPVLNPLMQQALRVGKRAHAETGIDDVSRSLAGLALDRARDVLGDLSAVRAVVVGAGAMSGLAVARLLRAGTHDVTVVNRTDERSARLAELHGVRAASWQELWSLLGAADLVLTATGAVGHVVDAEDLAAARACAGRSEDPQVLLDLALPRDVDPDVTRLPGVRLWGLSELQREGAGHEAHGSATDAVLQAVQHLVDQEVAGYLVDRRAARLGPTLAALRESAARVVDAEMARLDQRLPHLQGEERAELRRTVQRVVDKLLHTPTVRVKQLQRDDGRGDYAHALRELFDLDPHEVAVAPTPALAVPRGSAAALGAPVAVAPAAGAPAPDAPVPDEPNGPAPGDPAASAGERR